jgi:hypothetical protein
MLMTHLTLPGDDANDQQQAQAEQRALERRKEMKTAAQRLAFALLFTGILTQHNTLLFLFLHVVSIASTYQSLVVLVFELMHSSTDCVHICLHLCACLCTILQQCHL